MTHTRIHMLQPGIDYVTACGESTKDMNPSELTTDVNFCSCWECDMEHARATNEPPVKANIVLGEGRTPTECEVVNAPNSCDKLYVLSVLSGGYYLVSASSMDDAFDEWIDYCEDRGYRGLVAQCPVRAGWLSAEEFQESLDKEENPPDMATGGNHGLFYTSPDVHAFELTSKPYELDTLNAILWMEHEGEYFGQSAFDEKDILASLALDLHAEAQDIDPYEEIEETEGLSTGDEAEGWRDVRLYLRPSLDWDLCTGLSDFDQDHRGWCGASSIGATFEVSCDKEEDGTHGFVRVRPGAGGFDLRVKANGIYYDTAKDLLFQVQDMLYGDKPSWLEVKN